jgi:ABC-type phosphate transport system substrate-binding protein
MHTALLSKIGGAALLLAMLCTPACAGVVVIGHPVLGKVDGATLQKIFTGKVIELDGIAIKAINIKGGSALRERFLRTYLDQDEEQYVSYWTVRRYIGKGVPPRELGSTAEVIQFVQNTPGAIGYIEDGDLKPNLNVLLKK